jgi:hypothetical protein
MLAQFWQWLRDNDAPNWAVLVFSLTVWPAILYWWNTRKGQSVPHFEVLPRGGQTAIGNQQFPSVELIFTNRTGQVVYLSRARLRGYQRRFPIPLAAARDISGGWCELKFVWSKPPFLVDHECILQTNESVMTNIATEKQMDNTFYSYRPGWFRRYLTSPKYFLLQYTWSETKNTP